MSEEVATASKPSMVGAWISAIACGLTILVTVGRPVYAQFVESEVNRGEFDRMKIEQMEMKRDIKDLKERTDLRLSGIEKSTAVMEKSMSFMEAWLKSGSRAKE